MKEVYCTECGMEITSKEDLVTALSFVVVVPYHRACYATALKGCQSAFVGNKPINGTSGNVSVVMCFLLALLFIFVFHNWLLACMILVPVIIRLYSWLKYERHLPS